MRDFNEDLNPDEPFNEWAMRMYNKVIGYIQLLNDGDELIDPRKLNLVLAKFGENYGYLAMLLEIAKKNVADIEARIIDLNTDMWPKAVAELMEESGQKRVPAAETINNKIKSMDDGTLKNLIADSNEAKHRCGVLSGFAKVLDKKAGIIQTICSNMRSELFYAGGIPIGSDLEGGNRAEKFIKGLIGERDE